MTTFESRSTRTPLRWLAFTVLVLILSGCVSVNWAPNYDPIMDETVSKLQADTAAFFEKLDGASGSTSSHFANKAFYDQAMGTVEAMHTRASVLEENLPEKILTGEFIKLKQQYEDLQDLHRSKMPAGARNSAKAAMDQTFRAILFHIRFLKTDQAGSSGT